VLAAGYTVSPVVPEDLPWSVRVWLRLARKSRKGRAGLILYGIVRQGPRQISRQLPYASISEGKRTLGVRSPTGRLPKWFPSRPGAHEFSFLAGNSIRSSSFQGRVTLNEGDVLVAVCEPVQPRTCCAFKPRTTAPGSRAKEPPSSSRADCCTLVSIHGPRILTSGVAVATWKMAAAV